MYEIDKIEAVIKDVMGEYDSAVTKNGAFNSMHEAYAVLLEEVDEFWDEVKKKPANRSHEAIYKELIQIAAMAIRSTIDVIDDGFWESHIAKD